jgi:endonuclease/exonuclease/phosphatase family metal-dependent hydrolase
MSANKKRSVLFKVLKMSLTILVILLFVLIPALVIFYFWASSGTQPRDKLSEIITYTDKPEPPQSQESQEIFTVMTYNIGYLSAMTNNQPVKRPGKSFFDKNMEAFLRLLNETQPDIIGLQEVDFHSQRSHYVNQLKTIAEKADYPYSSLAINWDKRYLPFPSWPPSLHFGRVLSGQAVLSRWPILSTERIVLPKPGSTPFFYNAFYLDRLIQVVKIKIGRRNLVILNVHLDAIDRETRQDQAQRLLNIYHSFKDDYPVLLLGDFNSIPPDAPQKKDFPDEPVTDFRNDRTIPFFLEDPGLKAADISTFTFPTPSPTRKLDYIFYTHAQIELIKVFVPVITCSDHLPTVMQFSLK